MSEEYPFPDGVKLAIAMPHTMSLIPTATHHSLFCVSRPERCDYLIAIPGGDLANRREIQIEAALQRGSTHIWLIDGDMVFHSDILIRLFNLLRDGADLAGGICYRGSPPFDPIALHPTENRNMIPYEDFQFGDVIKPKATGTACLLVKREVFEKVPKPWFSIIRRENNALAIKQSLDIYFTRRATDLGFNLWIDTSKDVGHLRQVGIERDFYLMTELAQKVMGPEGNRQRLYKLSQKLADPWWAKRFENFIEERIGEGEDHGAPKSWRIISANSSLFAGRLAKLLGIKNSPIPDWSFDGLLFVDMLPGNFELAKQCRETPKICYWTGSDAEIFINDDKLHDFGPAIHITDSPWLVTKLNPKLPKICFVPMPPDLSTPDIPLDADPGILLYINQHSARDIGRSLDFIRCIRDIPIYVMSGPGKRVEIADQENVVSLGYLSEKEREKIFQKIAVYVRFMLRDGLSQTVIEMKMLGRSVFWTSEFPFCEYIKQKETVQSVAERVREAIKLPADENGAKWYRSTFTVENFRKIIGDLCTEKGWSIP